MNIMELGALGEFVGSVGVVVTLFYLAIQIRQNTEQQKRVEMESRVSAVNASAAALRENRKAVYQDAELAEIFWIGMSQPEELSEIRFLRFRILMQNILDGLWDFHSRTALTGLSPEIWGSLGVKAVERMIDSNGGRLVWTQFRSAYPLSFGLSWIQFLIEAIPKPTTLSYCTFSRCT